MKPWKRVFCRSRSIALPGATVEKEMFAASSRDPLVGWEAQNGNDEMLFSICFPLSLFISLFPAHYKTLVIILCRRLVIRTSCARKTQVGVRRRKIFIS